MLDPIGRREIMDTIRHLNEAYGMTVILITHHMDEAAKAQRLVVMSDGKIIEDGPPKRVFQQVEALRAAGLSVPDTVGLLYELQNEGIALSIDAISDEECAEVLAGLLS
jgi:energy-coupling factor transport system ATP-binding protein